MTPINKDLSYAVVGASTNPDKYGHKVFKDLLESGFDVVPINPHAKQILNKKVFPDLKSSPQKIDVAVMVVPPDIAQKIISQAADQGINHIWFQPGSESEAAIQAALDQGMQVTSNACIMVQRQQ